MDEQEFVDQVQARAGLRTRDEAERAVLVTMRMLGNQLPEQLRSPLAQMIPAGLGEALQRPWADLERGAATPRSCGPWVVEETFDCVERAEAGG